MQCECIIQGMFRRKKLVVISACVVLGLILFIKAYYPVPSKPTSDELAVYEVVLASLSQDWGFRLALADTTSQLVTPAGESWVPAELQPDPVSRAAAPEQFVEFCGDLCGHDFMRKNLRKWQLMPSSNEKFPFPVVSSNSTVLSHPIRAVSVTRCGFDVWHRRAVVSYSFDASTDGSLHEPAAMCAASGDIFLKRVNRGWQVIRMSRLCL